MGATSPYDVSPPDDHVNVTASDVTEYKNPPLRAIVVGGAGTLILTSLKGNDATYTVVAGQTVVGIFTKVKAASTATGLVGQY